MAANYLFVLALSLTSASSALVLEQCATCFVFFGSVMFLKDERLTILKVIAVLICLAGVACVSFGDSQQDDSKIPGDLLAIGSALFSAIYMIGQKRFLAGIDLLQLLWFLNFLSFWVFGLYWIVLVVLNFTGAESITRPSSMVIIMLAIGSILSFGFNLAVNRALLVVSPLFVRLSVIATLPISFLIDLFVGSSLHWLKFGGVCLVIAGFVGYVFQLHYETRSGNDSDQEEQIRTPLLPQ